MFKDLGSFLARFSNLTPPDQFIKEELLRVIFAETGITLSKNAVDMQGNTAFIQAKSPAIKNEILLYKGSILKKMENARGRVIRDIR